jgi:predicted CXXCH cytochrome family protein
LLRRPAAELCGRCHGELAKRIRNDVPHGPVGQGRCLTCHAAHGSENEGMTRASASATCAGCHEPSNPILVKRHAGRTMTGADCTSCHDPHAQPKGRKGLMLASQHPPFALGQCASCHVSGSSTAVTAKPPELCYRCHETSRAWSAKASVHAPLRDRESCLACHGAHAGAGQRVTQKQGDGLCYGCHDAKLAQGAVVHKALEQGCKTCHDPHATDNPKLLTTSTDKLCRGCHADMSQHYHPVSGKIDPRTGKDLDCMGCHVPHAGEFKRLLSHDPNRELCIQCHDPNMERPRKKG